MAVLQTREANDRNFRRGAIMGLTIAESFILLIFCLLLLFFFWQVQRDREDKVRAETTRDRDFVMQLDGLVSDGSIDALLDLKRNGIDIREVSGFAQADDYWRFISEPDLRRLLDGAVKLDQPQLTTLADSVTVPEALGLLQTIVASNPGPALDKFLGLPADKQQLFLDVQDQGLAEAAARLRHLSPMISPDDIASLLSLMEQGAQDATLLDLLRTIASMAPEQQERLLSALEQNGPQLLSGQQQATGDAESRIRIINERIAAAAAAEEQLIGELQSQLGDVVRGVGGEITEDGRIVLPERVVFDQGQATIKPALRTFLEQACPPWIALLSGSGLDIGVAEIQGHASREWRSGTGEEMAFRNNLELSQVRSRNVLNTCLAQIADLDLANWARAHLVAVGYSSSHPVIQNGEINDDLSRRVEFSFKISRDAMLDSIRQEVTN